MARRRHVWVRLAYAREVHAGIVLEWRNGDGWEARVHWIHEQTGVETTEWLRPESLTPLDAERPVFVLDGPGEIAARQRMAERTRN